MSAMISLKHTIPRRTDTALHLIQHGAIIIGLVSIFGAVSVLAKAPQGRQHGKAVSDVVAFSEALPAVDPAPIALAANLQAALNFVARRYHVSPEALKPIFEVAQLVGRERHIDPLLIVAIIGIESRFNPFAESVKGAQGLMQVIPRFHLDKLPDGARDNALLDPVTNVSVGVHVLQEAIRRNGGLEAGLQSYGGSSDSDGLYANRVLAEKERLEQAARQRPAASA